MKEAIVHEGPRVEIVDSPIPKAGPSQVVTKVHVSGSNPKDWKYPEWTKKSINWGDDIAGVIHEVGEDVFEFKPGDRVAAFHTMKTPHGSYAEYAVSEAYTTFHIPRKTSFEEAATIPLAAMTAALGLYQKLELPEPWRPALKPIPLLVYGGASAVGAFAIKLARLSNIHPIVAVAGRGEKFVEGLIDRSKGDAVIDYRKGDDHVVNEMLGVLKRNRLDKFEHAFDAVSEKGSHHNVARVMAPHGRITTVLPLSDKTGIPETIQFPETYVGAVHQPVAPDSEQAKAGIRTGTQEFGYVFFRFFAVGLLKGYFHGHPYEVIPGGLYGVQDGLANLRAGKASGVKYVFRIGDTKGAGSG